MAKGKAPGPADANDGVDAELAFVPLLNSLEKPEFVKRRQTLFERCWARVDAKVQHILRESNQATLDQVGAFVEMAGLER